MFDNFCNVFGTGQMTNIEVRSKGHLPKLKISNELTQLDMQAEVAIKNPLNRDLDAILINTTVEMDLIPALMPLPQLSLTATLKNITLRVTGVRTLYKQNNVSVDRIDTTL